jgi:hypothetical protein
MFPTDKQLEYIHYIEEFSPLLFTGNTKEEASKYIDENKGYIPLDERINTWAIINGY